MLVVWALGQVRRRTVGGGKIAKRRGDVAAQLRLVVFDREQIMAVTVADMLADLALREDGVAHDDRALIAPSEIVEPVFLS